MSLSFFSTLHSIEISVLSENIPQPGYNFLHLENTQVISPNSKVQADQEEFLPTWHPPSLLGRELPAELSLTPPLEPVPLRRLGPPLGL